MLQSEFIRKSTGGGEIYFRHWHCENPEMVISLVHGLGEHCNRYQHVAEYFNQRHVICIGYDRQGHGKSYGKRGHVANFSEYLDEIELLLNIAKGEYQGLPVFLYGHSMGGNLVLNHVLSRSPGIAGVVATGSWIRLPNPPSALLMGFAKIMHALWPRCSQSNRLDIENLCSDKEVVGAYLDDPLVHDQITISTAMNMFPAADFLNNYSGEFPVPLLLMHGGADNNTSPEGSIELAGRLNGEITLKIWDNFFHEIHNEPEKLEVLKYIWNWMQQLSLK